MSGTVGEMLNKIKTSCDPKTMMFCFKDTKIAKAYNRTVLYTPWESRVKPISSYINYSEQNVFESWKQNDISAAGNVAFDSREHSSKVTVKIEYSGNPADSSTKKKTTTTTETYNFNGTITTTVEVMYTYNNKNYTTPIEGSLDRPLFGVAVDQFTTNSEVFTANPNYLRVYKFVPDNIGIYYWTESPYFCEFKTERLSSGNIDSYYAYKNEDDTYYIKDILKRSVRKPLLNVYYKNSQGIWIDYNQCIRSYPEYDVEEASKIWTERLRVDNDILPRCEYIDENKNRYFIDNGDGQDTYAENCTSIELDTVKAITVLSEELEFNIDTEIDAITFLSGEVVPHVSGFVFNHWSWIKDGAEITSMSNKNLNPGDVLKVYAVYYRSTGKVLYEPYSLDDPTIPWKRRFMYDDLKITLPEGYKKEQFLVWLNGAFVPSTKDNTYEHIMYLENAMTMIGSKTVNQKLGSSYTDGDYGTVITSEENDEYRYDINLRLFGWKGVKVSNFYRPVSSTTTPITYNFESIYPLKTLTFPVAVNKSAHLIMCNGKVLDSSEYFVDENNPKTIILKNIEADANILLDELVKEIDENLDYYENVNPLHLLRSMILERTYSLINFEAEDPTKVVELHSSNACAVDFPKKGEITFTRLRIGDMVLINGLFEPYIWVHQNTIKIPKTANTYSDGVVDKLYAENVIRYYFVLKNK